jgi:hypothetical protein
MAIYRQLRRLLAAWITSGWSNQLAWNLFDERRKAGSATTIARSPEEVADPTRAGS